MNRYSITEEQLKQLVELADWADRIRLVDSILHTQGPLVPVEKMRDAAQHAWGQSQSLACGPVAVTDHSTQPPASE